MARSRSKLLSKSTKFEQQIERIHKLLDMRASDDRGECAGPDQTDIPGSDRKDSPGQKMLVSRAHKSVSDADPAPDRAAKLGRNRAQRCDRMLWMHRVMLTLSLLAIFAAVAGGHGLF
jgi:hypothetical protein